MDPVGANTDYSTIKGMYKTEDLVTPKNYNQNSQLTDYNNNNVFNFKKDPQNKTNGNNFNINSMYKTATTADQSSPQKTQKTKFGQNQKPPLLGHNKILKGSSTSR